MRLPTGFSKIKSQKPAIFLLAAILILLPVLNTSECSARAKRKSQKVKLPKYDDWDPNIPVATEPTTQKTIPLPGLKEFVVRVGNLSKPVKANPNNGIYWLTRGDQLMDFGLYKEAAHDLKIAQRLMKGKSDKATLKLALCHFNLNDYSQTLWISKKILAKDKNSSDGHVIRALGLIEHPSKAIAECNKAINSKNKKPWHYVARARILQANNLNWKKSKEDCSTALTMNPNLLSARLFRATAEQKLAQYKEAIDDCNKILKKEPVYFQAFKVRSKAQRKLGNQVGANTDYFIYKTCLKRMKQVVKDNQK